MNTETNINYLRDVVSLLKEYPDGFFNMIYADPDYNVGKSYGPSQKPMTDELYQYWCKVWARSAYRKLADDGNMFIINYPRNNAILWVELLDKMCYNVVEYVWIYNTNIGQSNRKFTTAHRTILHITKSKDNRFYKNEVAVPYKNPGDKRIQALIEKGSKGRMPYSWFYFDLVKNVSREKTSHPCQIPELLSEMLVRGTTTSGDTVLIMFGGSGSEVLVCDRLRRKWVVCEIEDTYHRLINIRLDIVRGVY